MARNVPGVELQLPIMLHFLKSPRDVPRLDVPRMYHGLRASKEQEPFPEGHLNVRGQESDNVSTSVSCPECLRVVSRKFSLLMEVQFEWW